jgi:hypothetical protein
MTVHIDRAHHHPRVYKWDGSWRANCPRCGPLLLNIGGGLALLHDTWRPTFVAALCHATEAHS